jgi:NAD(P)-dependent dehydrogenase (short-subunit alcohol dehydrogenase family)
MSSPAVSNEMYVILGATGNTGSIVANFLLSKGQKVRVIGRDTGRLQPFVDKGAEAFTADLNDAAALAKTFSGARAACRLQRCPSLPCGVKHRNSPRVDCRTGHHRIAETARGDRRTQETRDDG